MRALQLESLDGPSALRLVADAAEPTADGDGVVLVEVHAAGVGFPDLLMTRGQYQVAPPLPFVPGLEVAGVVRSAPAGAGVAPGDRVAAYVAHGGFAELVAAPAAQVVPLPAELSYNEGVALAVNYPTAYLALVLRGRLSPGDTVVVHGAAGGLGSAALQVARAVGARTIAVVGDDPAKADAARTAGADVVVTGDDWADGVRAALGDGGRADVVLDPVGGDRFDASLRLLGLGGRAIVAGFAGGQIPQIAANRLLLRNVDAVGVAWGSWVERDPGLPRRIAPALAAMVADGHVRPLVSADYALGDGARALQDVAERRAVGKLALAVRA